MKSTYVVHRSRLAALMAAPTVFASRLLAASAILALAGCALPRGGPLLSEVEAARDGNAIVLKPITAEIAAASRGPERASFPAPFLNAPAFEYDKLGPGDGVDITVWERDGLNVFPTMADGAAKLGEFVLDSAGDIHVPHAGKVHAQGATPSQLRDVIVRRLSRLMLSFDVTVNASARKGRTVTVQGDVLKPGVYPIGQNAARLSELLGLAAPNQANAEQLNVTVRRRDVSGSVRLSDVYRDNADDIALLPGDSIVLSNVVERLYVLGAAGLQGSVKLTRRNFTLLDTLGDSRALNDAVANPRGVFLMRPGAGSSGAAADARPTVYWFDFTKPEQIALAGKFVVRDGDALLVSDAPFTQVQKALSAFGATLGMARSAGVISN
jgi:polysaccharide export outer membrane protein